MAGLGQPGAELGGVAVDADRLPGGGNAALAVREELQQLDGLLERSAATAGGSKRVGLRREIERRHQLLLAGGERVGGGALAPHPGAGLHAGELGVAGEGGAVGCRWQGGARRRWHPAASCGRRQSGARAVRDPARTASRSPLAARWRVRKARRRRGWCRGRRGGRGQESAGAAVLVVVQAQCLVAGVAGGGDVVLDAADLGEAAMHTGTPSIRSYEEQARKALDEVIPDYPRTLPAHPGRSH